MLISKHTSICSYGKQLNCSNVRDIDKKLVPHVTGWIPMMLDSQFLVLFPVAVMFFPVSLCSSNNNNYCLANGGKLTQSYRLELQFTHWTSSFTTLIHHKLLLTKNTVKNATLFHHIHLKLWTILPYLNLNSQLWIVLNSPHCTALSRWQELKCQSFVR